MSTFQTFNHVTLILSLETILLTEISILIYYFSVDALTNYHIYQLKTIHIYELTFVGQKSRLVQMVLCLGSQRAKTGVTQAVSLSGGVGNERASTLFLVVEAFSSRAWNPRPCCFSTVPRGCLHLCSCCPGVSPLPTNGRWNPSQTSNLSHSLLLNLCVFFPSSSWRHFSTLKKSSYLIGPTWITQATLTIIRSMPLHQHSSFCHVT